MKQSGVFHSGFVKAGFEVFAELIVYNVHATDTCARELIYYLLVDVNDVGAFKGIEGTARRELRIEAHEGLVGLRVHVLELGDHGFER